MFACFNRKNRANCCTDNCCSDIDYEDLITGGFLNPESKTGENNKYRGAVITCYLYIIHFPSFEQNCVVFMYSLVAGRRKILKAF